MRKPDNDDMEEIQVGMCKNEYVKKWHIFYIPALDIAKKSCLILALIIGYHHMLYQKCFIDPCETSKNSKQIYNKIKKLKSDKNNKEGLKVLKNCYLNTVADLNLPVVGPHPLNSTVKTVCDYFNCNCIILSEGKKLVIHRYPKNVDFKRPTVVLLLSKPEGEDCAHVDLILNHKKYLKVSYYNLLPLLLIISFYFIAKWKYMYLLQCRVSGKNKTKLS